MLYVVTHTKVLKVQHPKLIKHVSFSFRELVIQPLLGAVLYILYVVTHTLGTRRNIRTTRSNLSRVPTFMSLVESRSIAFSMLQHTQRCCHSNIQKQSRTFFSPFDCLPFSLSVVLLFYFLYVVTSVLFFKIKFKYCSDTLIEARIYWS